MPGTRVRIPFLQPELPELDGVVDDLRRIYESHRFSNSGPFEERLAAGLAAYLGVSHCLPVANATLGLMLAASVVKRSRGTKFLVPSFTFPPSALAAEWSGLDPVLCDIDPHTWQARVDPDELHARREEFALIVLCNSFGAPADITTWRAISERCDIPMIVDSAAGLGASYEDGTPLGRAGFVEVFSLQATKAFAAGEGGAVAIGDDRLAERIRSRREYGLDARREADGLGLNAKMSELHAAIGCRVLAKYDGILADRRGIAARYRERLEPRGFGFQLHGERSAYPFVPVRVPDGVGRDGLQVSLESAGIETRRYFSPPLHHQPRYLRSERIGELGVTDRVAQSILSLPIRNAMPENEIDEVCDRLIEHAR